MTRVRVDKHLTVEALLDEHGWGWSSKNGFGSVYLTHPTFL